MVAPAIHSCPTCQTLLLPGQAQLLLPTTCPGCERVVWLRTEFGPFVLREVIGRGAMSVVFRAFFTERELEVALKIIRPPFAAEPEDFLNFEEAAQRLVALEHPHCARVFAAGVEEGLAYLALEYLPHGSLAARLETTGRLSEIEMLDLGGQLAAGLYAGHAAGLLHGDFLPRRVRFAADGSARVTGFAESIFLDAAAEEVGIVRGRLCSLGPERLHGRPEDVRSDIFALGAALYESFIGVPPHGGEAHGEIVRDLADAESLRIEAHGRPLRPTTIPVLNQLLRTRPKDRPQSWAEASAALRRAREAIPDSAASARRPTASGVSSPRHSASAIRPAPIPQAVPVAPTGPLVLDPPNAVRTWVAVVLLALCVTAAGSFGWSRWRQSSKAPATPAPSVSPTPSPTKVPAKSSAKPKAAAKTTPGKKPGSPATKATPKKKTATSPKPKKASPPPKTQPAANPPASPSATPPSATPVPSNPAPGAG